MKLTISARCDAEAVGEDPQPFFVRTVETNPSFHPVHGPRLRASIDRT
ncbi:MAG: hypothetical protein WD532_00545 [Acidimicrobiia bacterium]